MSAEGVKGGCLTCGRRVVTDVPRVGISLRPEEAAALARDTSDPALRERLLCALGTVDRLLVDATRAEMLVASETVTPRTTLGELAAIIAGEWSAGVARDNGIGPPCGSPHGGPIAIVDAIADVIGRLRGDHR